MDLTFQVPNSALYSIRSCFHHQSHPQLGIVFALAPSLHSFWSYFSTDLQQHIGHLPTWGVPLSVSYLFAFSYCPWGSQGKNTAVFCHSLLQWTTFCQTSPPWPDRLGWPHTAWLSFTELDKALVLWSDWLVFCDYGLSVSALWCALTPTVLLGFLSPCKRGVSLHGCTSKAQVLLLTLDEGYLLTTAPPELERGVAPLALLPQRSSRSLEVGWLLSGGAPDLSGGLVPLWPWTWGSSTRPPLLPCRSLALPVTTPDLGRGAAPHGQASARSVAASALILLIQFLKFTLYLQLL